MKIIVFGASGKTGIEVCKQATQKGMTVIGFDILQSPQLTSLYNFTFIKGSVLNAQAVKKALKGVDAVVSELGVRIGNAAPIVSEGNKNIIAAMKAHKIKRLITQSAFGAQESWQPLPFYYKLIHKYLLGPIAIDKNAMEQAVTASNLNWTIIRPVRLTSGQATCTYRVGNTQLRLGINPRISRADVAHFIINELNNNKYVHSAVTISY